MAKNTFELPPEEKRKIEAILDAAVSGKPKKAQAQDMSADSIDEDTEESMAGEEEEMEVDGKEGAAAAAGEESDDTEDLGEDTEEEGKFLHVDITFHCFISMKITSFDIQYVRKLSIGNHRRGHASAEFKLLMFWLLLHTTSENYFLEKHKLKTPVI